MAILKLSGKTFLRIYKRVWCSKQKFSMVTFVSFSFLPHVYHAIQHIYHDLPYHISRLIYLTRWGQMIHICASKLTIIGSDNGLSPDRRQAIIWNNAGILLIWLSGTNLKISIKIQTFSFEKMHLKMSSGQWWPFLSLPQWVKHKKACFPFHGSLTSGCARVQQYQQIMP